MKRISVVIGNLQTKASYRPPLQAWDGPVSLAIPLVLALGSQEQMTRDGA